LKYFEKAISGEYQSENLYLHKMKLSHIPNFKFTGGCDPIYSIKQNEKTIFISKKLK